VYLFWLNSTGATSRPVLNLGKHDNENLRCMQSENFLSSCATVSLLIRNQPHGTSPYLIPAWYVTLGLETIFHSIEQIKWWFCFWFTFIFVFVQYL